METIAIKPSAGYKHFNNPLLRAPLSVLRMLPEEKQNEIRRWFARDLAAFSAFALAEPYSTHIVTSADGWLGIEKFHVELCDTLSKETRTRVALCVPRDHAKSTFATVANTLHKIACKRWLSKEKQRHYIQIISESQDQAIIHLDAIANELELNDRLAWVAGHPLAFDAYSVNSKNRVVRLKRKRENKWNATEIETSNGIYIEARGLLQKFRGRKKVAFRPDLVLLDDIEGNSNTGSEPMRAKVRLKVDSEILPAIAVGGQVLLIGNLTHSKSFMAEVLRAQKRLVEMGKKPFWKTFFYSGIIDIGTDKERALCPNLRPLEWLYEKWAEYTSRNQGHIFEQEYLNRPADVKDKPFVGHIKFMRDSVIEKNEYGLFITAKVCDRYGEIDETKMDIWAPVLLYNGVDLAILATDESCLTGLVTIARDSAMNNFIPAGYDFSAMLKPGEAVDAMFYIDNLLDIEHHMVETNSFQHLFFDEEYWFSICEEKKQMPILEKANESTDKIARISRLHYPAKMGHLWVDIENKELIDDLEGFEDIQFLDRLDALEKAVRKSRGPSLPASPINPQKSGNPWWRKSSSMTELPDPTIDPVAKDREVLDIKLKGDSWATS